MRISNNYNDSYSPAFQAKFFHSESLKMIADYAVEHNKFQKLNQARKNIDAYCLPVRLRVDIGRTEKGFPSIVFTKFMPKSGIIVPTSMNDYVPVKSTTYVGSESKDLLKFALEKLIKLGNDAPKNNMFKNIVIKNS